MSDRVILLKKTKSGVVKDTIYESSDTLTIDVSGAHTIELPNKPIEVNIPGKDWFDYSLGTITIVGAVIAAFYTWKSIRKLYQKDEDKQNQINKLSSIAEKMESQNAILKESNSIMSRQVEALSALAIPDSQSEAAQKLVQIEEEKRELEFRPKLFSNMFTTAQSNAGFKIENGGKPITIVGIELDVDNIQLINRDIIGKTIPENGVFNINTRTLDGSEMNNKDYNVIIHCTNDLGSKYEIKMNSKRMDSLRTAKKVE